jgi:hypothetical protein
VLSDDTRDASFSVCTKEAGCEISYVREATSGMPRALHRFRKGNAKSGHDRDGVYGNLVILG